MARLIAALARPSPRIIELESGPALHEIRHKSHLPGLYRQVLRVLEPDGVLLVCDHNPMNETERSRALYATSDEQIAFMEEVGFSDVRLRTTIEGLYLVSAHRP